ncbi:MAG: sensor histidine kinase [Solirubrobacterales bacterium]|nr:sensor histidine kinase [Solirubrobacterales bacterium]
MATIRTLLVGRRRLALNEALHELRRPLQALALGAPAGRPPQFGADSSLQMAAAALERLEREINGQGRAPAPTSFRVRPLLESAAERWRQRAAIEGRSVLLRYRGEEVTMHGDRRAIAQALDNLIINGIEHGGGPVVLSATPLGGRLRVSIGDSGRGSRHDSGADPPASVHARLTGRRRHGHGLRVVRRIAAAHGGAFQLHRTAAGTEARLELPLLGGRGAR